MYFIDSTDSLIVLIPAHNEELSIGKTIREIYKHLPEASILVIDNNSTDKTGKIAKENGAEVIFEPGLGKGRAFRAALSKLPKKFSAILLIDGDATYEILPVLKALPLITDKKFDMVVGIRHYEEDPTVKPRPGHLFGNKLFTILNKLFYSNNVKDSLSGWRLLSHEFVYTFPSNSKGFELETELNAHAKNFDLTVSNVKVNYRSREKNSKSKLRTYQDGFKILLSNFAIAFQTRPFVFLSLPAILSICLSVPLITRAVSGYVRTGLVGQLPSLIVGISLLFSGVIFLSIGYVLQEIRRVYISTIRQNYVMFSIK